MCAMILKKIVVFIFSYDPNQLNAQDVYRSVVSLVFNETSPLIQSELLAFHNAFDEFVIGANAYMQIGDIIVLFLNANFIQVNVSDYFLDPVATTPSTVIRKWIILLTF